MTNTTGKKRGGRVSCSKGGKHGRKPKHQNSFAFKHNKNSVKTARLIRIPNKTLHCCPSCTKQINWRVKFRKYKPLKQPRRCNECDGKGSKGVLSAYHTVCQKCAKKKKICAKCTTKEKDWLEVSDSENVGNDSDEEEETMTTGSYVRKSNKSCRRRGILSASKNNENEKTINKKEEMMVEVHDPFAVAVTANKVDPFAAAMESLRPTVTTATMEGIDAMDI
eukprot:g372.t1